MTGVPELAHPHSVFHPLVGVPRDQNLPRPGIGFEPLGGVHLVADSSVVGPPFRTDISRDHNSRVDADSHVQAYLGKFYESDARQSFLNRQGTAHGTQRIILVSNGGAEKGHESIAAKFVESSPELEHGIDDQLQIAVEDVDHILGIELFGEGSEAAEIAEKNCDFALVAAHFQMTPGIRNDFGRDIRRDISAEQIPEQMIFCFDLVVKRFNSEQRFHSRQKLFTIDRFTQKIIGS